MQAGAAMAVVGWWTGYKLEEWLHLIQLNIFNKLVTKTIGKLHF